MNTDRFRSAVHGQIPVLRASGIGGTSLAAFHAALAAIHLEHFNIVRLSSVIPPRTSVDATGKAPMPMGEVGDRMYCVYAEQRAMQLGEQAWTGVGWVQRLDGEGGLFVEHEGGSEEFVVAAIRTSLEDLAKHADEEYGDPDWVINGAVCTGEPVCSLVIAPFECAPWSAA